MGFLGRYHNEEQTDFTAGIPAVSLWRLFTRKILRSPCPIKGLLSGFALYKKMSLGSDSLSPLMKKLTSAKEQNSVTKKSWKAWSHGSRNMSQMCSFSVYSLLLVFISHYLLVASFSVKVWIISWAKRTRRSQLLCSLSEYAPARGTAAVPVDSPGGSGGAVVDRPVKSLKWVHESQERELAPCSLWTSQKGPGTPGWYA